MRASSAEPATLPARSIRVEKTGQAQTKADGQIGAESLTLLLDANVSGLSAGSGAGTEPPEPPAPPALGLEGGKGNRRVNPPFQGLVTNARGDRLRFFASSWQGACSEHVEGTRASCLAAWQEARILVFAFTRCKTIALCLFVGRA